MFLSHTKFSLLSLELDDDDGFPRMHVCFNTSDKTSLSLACPDGTILFSDVYYNGIHNESMYLAGYRTTPSAGKYTLKATDAYKNIVFENELQLDGPDLFLTHVSEDWWGQDPGVSLVGLRLTLRNTGALPAYPYSVIVHDATQSEEAFLIPTVILPHQDQQVQCFIHLPSISSGESVLNISVHGSSGAVLAQTARTIVPSDPISSWEYRWRYLGDNTMSIPDVDWFYAYYKNLKRFDIIDYAAYVFDYTDDSYLSFVANQLLSLTDATDNMTKINFIASFIQGITYELDDPLNESYEYPRYPLETLSEHHGDCEDKAILAASLLHSIGYNVSLIRLPSHMAVGVHLNETIPVYTPYIDEYYFLETTTPHIPLGKVPSEYQGLTNVTVYPISPRPLLIHHWKNATRYTISNGVAYVKVHMIIENLGSAIAPYIEVRGAFYDDENQSYNEQITVVSSLAAGDKRIAELTMNIPPMVSTVLRTQLYLGDVMVHFRESSSRFS